MELPIQAYDYSKPEHKKLIIATFVEWAHMVGVREQNTADENVINAKFVITNFGGMTISEIRQAIQWSVVGRLPDVDATCYGKLSPIYMAKILNAYLDVRDKQMRIMRYKALQQQRETEYKAKFNRPLAERIEETKKLLIDHMKQMKVKRVGDMTGRLVWKFLSRAGKVTDGDFSDEAKQHARQQLAALKADEDYRLGIQKMTALKIMDSEEMYLQKCMQEYQIWLCLEAISDIADFVNSQPDDVVIPKEEQ